MAHEILADHAAFDLPTWHGKGIYVGEKGFRDSAHVIEAVGFQDYQALPMTYETGGKTFRVEDNFVLARPRFESDGPGAPFIPVGNCTSAYKILQPREAFVPFDVFVKAGHAHYTAAGMLRNGESIWIAAKMETASVRPLPKSSGLSGDDTVDSYLMLSAGFTGKLGLTMNNSPIRTVCANTQRAAIAQGDNVRLIHSQRVHENLDKAGEKLAELNAQFKLHVDAMKRMNATKATTKRVDAVFDEMFPITTEDGIRHFVSAAKVAKMKELAETGIGNGGGTMYDLWNGITQYLDYQAENKNETPAKLLDSTWNGTRAQHRQTAFDAIMKQAA